MRVHRPESLASALQLLVDATDDTKVIAGGTALMLMMRAGLVLPDELVSLDRVPDLTGIDVGDDAIRIGASTTLRDVERSPELAVAAPTLAAATGLVANHRVRHRATVGGNLSEADYASDPPAVLVALGAEVRLVSTAGERVIPVSAFLVDYYETALEPDELLTEVRVPRPPAGARSTYLKFVTRSEEDRPCVGVAAYLARDEAGRCSDLRIAVAGATATPFVVEHALAACRGRAVDDRTWAEIATAYGDAIQPIDDLRGSAEYRKLVTAELVQRALHQVSAPGQDGAVRI